MVLCLGSYSDLIKCVECTDLFPLSVGFCFGGRAIVCWTCDPCSPCSLWRPCIITALLLHVAYNICIAVNKGVTVYITFVRALAVSTVENAIKSQSKEPRRVYRETIACCLLIGAFR